MILKESSLKVVVREIVYAAESSKRMRSCATKYPEYDNFHHIYSDLASIFEGFGTSFLAVLLLEGDFEAVIDDCLFNMPSFSRSVVLVSFGETHQRLGALIAPAIAHGAGIALLSSNPPHGLPEEVEIMPLNSLSSVLGWADYLALDISREMAGHLPEIVDISGFRGKAEALVTAPMPCGGRADCGVCAITLKRGYKLICKDGPVFDLEMLLS